MALFMVAHIAYTSYRRYIKVLLALVLENEGLRAL